MIFQKLYSELYDYHYGKSVPQTSFVRFAELYKSNDHNERLGLEIGCGSGRNFRELLKIYNKIEGVDLSGDMLERAARCFGDDNRISLRRGDYLRLEPTVGRYDGIVAVFHVVSYICSETPLEALLSRISGDLKDRGYLIFDYWSDSILHGGGPRFVRNEVVVDEQKYVREVSPSSREDDKIVELRIKISKQNSSGETLSSESELHKLRYFNQSEIIEAIRAIESLELIELGRYDGNSDSPFNRYCILRKLAS